MAAKVFIDTSGYYALLVQGDDRHAAAAEWLREAAAARTCVVTTDYVLDETATLLKARGYGHLLAGFFAVLSASRSLQIVWMDPEEFGRVQALFLKHADQTLSFTDCFSFHVMRELGIHDALTKDAHFRNAGFNPLLE
jgi:predicted nucleic acid-binding protein